MVSVQVKQPVDKLFHLTAAGNKTSDPDRQETTININKNSVFLEGKKNLYRVCYGSNELIPVFFIKNSTLTFTRILF